MTNKPKYRMVAKSKQSGEYQDVAAFWENEKGVSGKLDRRVTRICVEMEDGSKLFLSNENCYFNLQIARNEHDQGEAPEHMNQAPPKDDEVPF